MLPQRSAVRAYLGIGSNQGDRRSHLQQCVSSLAALAVQVERASGIYESTYVGPGPAQPDYLNAVLEVSTRLAPEDLLGRLQELERAHGRAPGTHLQPRSLDVDILFYGRHEMRQPTLVLPHPRVADRRFVLEPLEELGVLDDLPQPGLRQRLQQLRQQQVVTPLPASLHVEESRGFRV